MSINLGDAILYYKGDLSGLNDAMGQAQRNVESSMGNILNATDKVGIGFTAFGAAIAAPLAIGVKSAIDFESAFAGVRKTVDASPPELAAMSDEFRKLATEIPVSVTELLSIGEAAGQLGVRKENILGFTRTIADLGVSSNLTGEEGASMLAKFANITGMDQAQFGNLGSAIVALGNNGASTEADIANMGLRIAGAGNIANMTEGDILGIANALSSVGIDAEAGGTAISKVILDMKTATESGGEALDQFAQVAGMSADQFRQKFQQDAAGALTDFISGLSRLESSGGSVTQTLDAMGLSDIRVRDALLRSSSAADMFAGSIKLGNQAFADNNALSNEAAERYKTTESQMQLVKNQFNDLAITAGQALLPALKDLLSAASPIIKDFGDFAKANPELTQTLVVAAAAVGGVSLALGAGNLAIRPLVQAWTGFSSILGYFRGDSDKAAAGLTGLTQDTKALDAAVSTATTGYGDFSQEIKEGEDNLKRLDAEMKAATQEVKQQEQAVKGVAKEQAENNRLYAQAEKAVEQQRQALIKSNQELTESKTKLEAARQQAKDFAAGLDTTGISASEMRQKLVAAKQAVVDAEIAMQRNNAALKEAKADMDTVSLRTKDLSIRLDEAKANATQAATSLERLGTEAKQAGTQLDMLRNDAAVLSTGLDRMGTAANTTRGHVANLGGKIGNAGGLASDVLQLVGVTNPAVNKIAEFGNVAAQAGVMFGGGSMAVAAATPAITGAGTAATGAAAAVGSIGIAALAIPAAIAAAAAASVLLLGAIALKGAVTVKELIQSGDSLDAKEKEYQEQLRQRGVVIDENAVKAMGFDERQRYYAEQEKSREDVLLRAHLAHYLGREETEQEFARARNLRLNENISAEEAALIVSLGLSQQKLTEVMHYDTQETESFLRSIDTCVTGQRQGDDQITQSAMESAQLREQAFLQSAQNIANNDAQAVGWLGSLWSDFTTGMSALVSSVISSIGNQFTSLWNTIKRLFGFADGGVVGPGGMPIKQAATGGIVGYATGGLVQAMAAGGYSERATILAGEEGPELAIAPSGMAAILGANGPGLYNVPVHTEITPARETSGLRLSKVPHFASGGTVEAGGGVGNVINVNVHMNGAVVRDEMDIRKLGDMISQRIAHTVNLTLTGATV